MRFGIGIDVRIFEKSRRFLSIPLVIDIVYAPLENCCNDRAPPAFLMIRALRPSRTELRELPDLHLGARFLELLLDLGSLLLRDPLLDRLGSSVHQVLRLLQAEAGHLADRLDHVDLLLADLLQDDLEFGLLLRSRGGGSARSGPDRHRDGCRSRDTPFFFEHLDQIRDLHHGQGTQVLRNRLQICHSRAPSFCRFVPCRAPGSGSGPAQTPESPLFRRPSSPPATILFVHPALRRARPSFRQPREDGQLSPARRCAPRTRTRCAPRLARRRTSWPAGAARPPTSLARHSSKPGRDPKTAAPFSPSSLPERAAA